MLTLNTPNQNAQDLLNNCEESTWDAIAAWYESYCDDEPVTIAYETINGDNFFGIDRCLAYNGHKGNLKSKGNGDDVGDLMFVLRERINAFVVQFNNNILQDDRLVLEQRGAPTVMTQLLTQGLGLFPQPEIIGLDNQVNQEDAYEEMLLPNVEEPRIVHEITETDPYETDEENPNYDEDYERIENDFDDRRTNAPRREF